MDRSSLRSSTADGVDNARDVCKGPVTHTITHVQRTKKEEFWSVRCDSLGVRQNLLMI